jgi:hypothetical protein
MAELQQEIAAYEGMKAELEAAHLGKWVLLHEGKLDGVFPDFEAAAKSAVSSYGRGPYLIRQVGAATLSLPTSLIYREIYEADSMRL